MEGKKSARGSRNRTTTSFSSLAYHLWLHKKSQLIIWLIGFDSVFAIEMMKIADFSI